MVKHIVVPEAELVAAKEQFEEVFSTCLHSIQRTNPKETRVYGRSWASNDDLIGVKVPQQENQKKEIASPEKKVEVKKEKSATPEVKFSKFFFPTIASNFQPSTSSKLSEPAKKEKKTIMQPKKNQNVMSMFAKKAEKKDVEPQKRKSPTPSPPPQERKSRKRPKVEIDEPEDEPKPKKKSPTPEKKKSLFEADDEDMPSSREPSVEREKEEVKKEKKTKKTVKQDIIMGSPEVEEKPVKPTRQSATSDEEANENKKKSQEKPRTMRMEKTVENYVDEDGYLGEFWLLFLPQINSFPVSKVVTKAVECSPTHSPEKPKPKVITAAVPGTSKAPKKNTMITSFFKKKWTLAWELVP